MCVFDGSGADESQRSRTKEFASDRLQRQHSHDVTQVKTDFGQTNFWPSLSDQLWPNRLWPKPTLAQTDFGQN